MSETGWGWEYGVGNTDVETCKTKITWVRKTATHPRSRDSRSCGCAGKKLELRRSSGPKRDKIHNQWELRRDSASSSNKTLLFASYLDIPTVCNYQSIVFRSVKTAEQALPPWNSIAWKRGSGCSSAQSQLVAESSLSFNDWCWCQAVQNFTIFNSLSQ